MYYLCAIVHRHVRPPYHNLVVVQHILWNMYRCEYTMFKITLFFLWRTPINTIDSTDNNCSFHGSLLPIIAMNQQWWAVMAGSGDELMILVHERRQASGRDLHTGGEDLGDGPDLQGGADGEQAHKALRRHPHASHVDALQPPALVHQRHQPGLRHMAAAPQYDALHMEMGDNPTRPWARRSTAFSRALAICVPGVIWSELADD